MCHPGVGIPEQHPLVVEANRECPTGIPVLHRRVVLGEGARILPVAYEIWEGVQVMETAVPNTTDEYTNFNGML